MGDVTVVGLGLMGSALARAILDAGFKLTVWNRSPAKMQPFVADGAFGAPDVPSAFAASPVILICVDNYMAVNALLQTDTVPGILAGRTVVQLSTGTPLEAQETSQWVAGKNASYLDGKILCGPNSIGTDNAKIMVSGAEMAYKSSQDLLDCLGSDVRYLGANVGAASAIDLAWLTTCYGRFMGIIHAANLCRSEGVGLDEFLTLFPDDPDTPYYAKVIHDQSFDTYTSTLHVWVGALRRIQQQGVDANINTEFPDFVAGIFKKAIDAGYGQENVMSLYKVLQLDNAPIQTSK
ncbi:MAG: NAD(P)-dependent oxidoreductase [Paracoccaceae bacterium]